MKINTKEFKVIEGQNVQFKKYPTCIKPFYEPKESIGQEILDEHIKELSDLQNILYADNRYALLVIFQAMDAAGKDGAIKHVMSGVNLLRGVRCLASNIPALKNWTMISYGVRPGICHSAAG